MHLRYFLVLLIFSVNSILNETDIQQVTDLLGRSPRGLVDIPVRTVEGSPVVIQVASLVEDKPFPTLYWLVDKDYNYAIDRLEASGYIANLQAEIDDSEAWQTRLTLEHKAHIAHRESLMSSEIKSSIYRLGYQKVFDMRGIGGIENFTRIRCLHTYYAAHLVSANSIGQNLDQFWRAQAVNLPALCPR